ncbi:MAG TPA: DJ-1/PfpI family protein [Pyrinomonadaceae bacterium]|nr:DJ-1/PfpI family protein [Pyrinomonadaceae bacterium]
MKRFCLTLALLAFAANFYTGGTACAQADRATPGARPQQKAGPRNLAILIFDGVQIIDYTGPYETFGHVHVGDGHAHAFNIYTVSEKTNAITTAMGMSVNPRYGFDNAPEPDVLLVPGGDIRGALDNPNVIKWVRDKANRAEMVLSVCNGAFILAKTGLLDGLEATTTANLIHLLREAAPRVRVVDDRRFVDNGKFITAAGLSSGIDGALHVVERLHGRATAQAAALGMEYNWEPESKFVRAALADKYMRFNYDVKVSEGGWKPLSRAGSQDAWENRWSVTTDTSAADVLASVNNTLAANRTYGPPPAVKWARVDNQSPKGATWDGVVSVVAAAGETNRFTLSVRVARAGASARLPSN